MAENSLRIRIRLDVLDKALGALKNIGQGSKETAAALKAAREQLKQLGAQQNALGNFAKHTKTLREAGNQLQVLKQQLQAMQAAGTASAAQMQKHQAAVDKQTAKYREQQATVFKLRNALNSMGVTSASQAQQRIGADIAATTAKINAQTEALKRQSDQQRKMAALQAKAAKGAAVGGGIAAAGMGAVYTGRRGLQEVGGLMAQSKLAGAEEIRIKALGMEQGDTTAAIDYAQKFRSYGTSATDNLALMRDAVTVFNDAHHAQDAMPFLAKMKFANEAAFGATDGAEHDRKFMDMMKVIEMRNGANSREDFERNGNLMQQVLTATGGRVGAEDWLHLIKTGGIAAKGLDEKEFFYRLEPLVQEMGGDRVGTGMMSAYQNLYQGRTTKRAANMLDELGLIADPSKVKHDKVGQIAQLGVGALKGSELFQKSQFQWMESVLIPALQAKGYTSEKQILDAMGGIFSNRNAAGLFATMYQQRAMVNKSYALNERADNVDTLHGRAMDSSAGKELELRKRLDDLKKTIGDTALPAYMRLLDVLARAAEGVQGFAQSHPGLVKALVYSAAALSALGVAAGALLIPLGLLVAKSMALRWMLARIGIGLPTVSGGLRAIGVAAGAAAKAGGTVPAVLASMGTALQAPVRGSINLIKALRERIRAVPGQPGVFARMGKAIAGAMGRASQATQAAYVGMREYLLLQGKSAVSSISKGTSRVAGGARRGIAAAAFYAAERGPKGIAKDALGGLGNLASKGISGVINGITTAFWGLKNVIAVVGRTMLMNPIGLAITAIAVAALLIVKYWEPIKAFFQGFWKGFTEGLAPLGPMFSAAFGAIGGALEGMRPVWDWLVGMFSAAWDWISKLFGPFEATKQSIDGATQAGQGFGAWLAGLIVTAASFVGQFFTIGSNIVGGLINGITSKLAELKDAVVGVASSAAAWFREKLDIHSPSRVFMQYGGFISEGAALGIESGQAGVRAAALAMAASAMVPVASAAVQPPAETLQALPLPAAVPPLPPLAARMEVAPSLVALPGQLPAAAMRVHPLPAAVPPLPTDALQLPMEHQIRVRLLGIDQLQEPAVELQGRMGGEGAGQSRPVPRIQRGTAIAPRPAAAQAPAVSSSYTITINPAPGQDPQAIARAVAAELDRRERQAGARRRSSLQDLN